MKIEFRNTINDEFFDNEDDCLENIMDCIGMEMTTWSVEKNKLQQEVYFMLQDAYMKEEEVEEYEDIADFIKELEKECGIE